MLAQTMLERSLILFGSYAFQAASAIVCLVVFLSLKKELHELRCRVTRLDFTLRLDAMNARLNRGRGAGQRTGGPGARKAERESQQTQPGDPSFAAGRAG